MTADERELVRRFQRGEPGSFDAFYDRYSDPVYRLCYRLCGHAADAEDLAQEVFLAAYQGLHRFVGRSSVSTWLYRIAMYRWQRLRAGPMSETVSLEEEPAALVSADPAAAGVERLSLGNALDALSVDLREAFLLVKAEGLKYREAAQVLDVPQGTLQYRVHEAVKKLRRLLQDERGEAGESHSPAVEAPCRGGLSHEL